MTPNTLFSNHKKKEKKEKERTVARRLPSSSITP
jgi:hypothetical protein